MTQLPRASHIEVDPSGLLVVTTTDVQAALAELDAAVDAVSGSGYTDPLTTKGDLVGRSSSATSRLPVGSDGQVLTADAASTLGVKWAAGGGASSPWYLSRKTLHGTYGDDFAGTSLNGRWTRRNIVGGDETWQAGESGVYVSGLVSGDMYLQTAPSGDFSLEVDCSQWSVASTHLCGPVIIDSAGAGIGVGIRNGFGVYLAALSSYAYASYGNGLNYAIALNTSRMWIRLNKSGTNYTVQYSVNGQVWSPASAATTSSVTVNRIGFGCFYSDSSGETLLSRFNVV